MVERPEQNEKEATGMAAKRKSNRKHTPAAHEKLLLAVAIINVVYYGNTFPVKSQ